MTSKKNKGNSRRDKGNKHKNEGDCEETSCGWYSTST